ncbi:hypothetical protein TCAL_15957, partial [Tigriopus californicus]
VRGFTLICDQRGCVSRPFVPVSARTRCIQHLYNLGHPGIRGTRNHVAGRFVWPGLSRDVHCFKVINVDLVGPLEVSNGAKYRDDHVDRFLRWPEFFPLSNISAESCVRTLLD